jgi:hypothetical protein
MSDATHTSVPEARDENAEESPSGGHPDARHRTVQIHVNKQPVQIEGPRVTGLKIKEAAIAQGVRITLDFALSELLPSGERKVIGNADVVTVTKHSKFTAVADDDNS